MDIKQTQGGLLGHYFRRIIHIFTFIIPLIYYNYVVLIVHYFRLSPRELLLAILVLILILELLRLRSGLLIFGQRGYEKKQISAFTWGLIAMVCVLLFAPNERYAIPILWSWSFGDPLLGELRRYGCKEIFTWIISIIFIMAIWLFCYWWLATPWWWSLIMGPLTVASEKPKLKWIDDNALMQLIPLIVLIIGSPP